MCLQCFDPVGWAAGRASSLKKTEWWGAGVVICSERGAGLHMAQLMLSGSAYLGSPGQRAVKRVCVCVCVRACVRACTRPNVAYLLTMAD